jgi:hypothetical protein
LGVKAIMSFTVYAAKAGDSKALAINPQNSLHASRMCNLIPVTPFDPRAVPEFEPPSSQSVAVISVVGF